MPGETSLNVLLQSLKVSSQPTTYVFVSLPIDQVVHPFPIPITDIRLWFWESEGVTIIIPLHLAEKYGYEFSYRCKMVTLDVHSSLEAVGFLAAVATRLAENGLSSNVVGAFYHDHLFVKEEEVEKVVSVLEELAREAKAPDRS